MFLRFRPLTGTAFLKWFSVNVIKMVLSVSVPSRGLHFSNPGDEILFKSYRAACFRPLAGTAFLK